MSDETRSPGVQSTVPDRNARQPALPSAEDNAGGVTPPRARKSEFREIVEVVLVALAIALLIRHFVVEVFVVDGRSMEPTLHSGERLLVNKFLFRFRVPERGEIIVFRYPRNPRRDFIKRVIAVPGDRVEIVQGRVMVNGVEVAEPFVVFRDTRSTAPLEVPEGRVWVMGDNRANSEDSRSFDAVPLRNVKGKAFLRFWPPARFNYFAAPGAA